MAYLLGALESVAKNWGIVAVYCRGGIIEIDYASALEDQDFVAYVIALILTH